MPRCVYSIQYFDGQDFGSSIIPDVFWRFKIRHGPDIEFRITAWIREARPELQETKIILAIRWPQWILVPLQDMNYDRISCELVRMIVGRGMTRNAKNAEDG